MATTTTINSNYAGKAAGEIFVKSFNEADAIKNGAVTVMPNAKFKLNLRKVAFANGKVNYTCGFAPVGSITLSENELILKHIKNDFEICKDDFRQTWDEELTPEMEDAIIASALAELAEQIGEEIWTGVVATTGEIGGLIPQFSADSSVITANDGIVPAGAAITKANVIAEFEKLESATPTSIRKKSDLVWSVSSNVATAYSQYLVAQGASNGFGGAGFEMKYGKYTIKEDAGLPDNTVVIARGSNLVFATNKADDMNQIKLVDTSETLLDGNIRGKIAYLGETGYYEGSEIVYYLSTVTPD